MFFFNCVRSSKLQCLFDCNFCNQVHLQQAATFETSRCSASRTCRRPAIFWKLADCSIDSNLVGADCQLDNVRLKKMQTRLASMIEKIAALNPVQWMELTKDHLACWPENRPTNWFIDQNWQSHEQFTNHKNQFTRTNSLESCTSHNRKLQKSPRIRLNSSPKKVDYFGSLSSSWAAGRKVSSSAESG